MSNYLFRCIEHINNDRDYHIKVVHIGSEWEAPYKFSDVLTLNVKGELKDLQGFCKEFNPHVCYVAGWYDHDYLKIARTLRSNGSKIIGALDNPWRGSLKQWIGVLSSPILLKSTFDYLWVPGFKQYHFARRLGFGHSQILTGLYVGDISLFKSDDKREKRKELLFAGRLEKVKGLLLLYQVFKSLSAEERNGWKLKIIGSGSLRQHLSPDQNIEIIDFLQPLELAALASQAGAYILPSYDEHWGVAVHEFAAAGLPLVVSTEVSSGEKFIIHGYNGFVFDAGDPKDLHRVLSLIFNLSDEEIDKMGKRSKKLAACLNHELWKATLTSVCRHV